MQLNAKLTAVDFTSSRRFSLDEQFSVVDKEGDSLVEHCFHVTRTRDPETRSGDQLDFNVRRRYHGYRHTKTFTPLFYLKRCVLFVTSRHVTSLDGTQTSVLDGTQTSVLDHF